MVMETKGSWDHETRWLWGHGGYGDTGSWRHGVMETRGHKNGVMETRGHGHEAKGTFKEIKAKSVSREMKRSDRCDRQVETVGADITYKAARYLYARRLDREQR